jgi:exonuclease SbcC
MKTDGTLQLLREHFTAVSDAGGDVLRAERHHKGKQLGVFYFDFSDAILQGNFDLKAYSQERIAPDFYRHEGSLQWNYYLYFVLERAAFEQLCATTRIAEVESDRTYARKFVRDRQTLNTELAEPLMELLGSTAPKQDLASTWTEKLTKAGLGQVADPGAPYVATVRDFIAGKSVESVAPPRADGSAPDPGRFVQSLQLDRFRDHPVQKNFELGTVNLLRGVNGSGKTSLLEAIELSICGGIRRQDGQRPSNSKIQVQYAGQTKPELCPSADAAIFSEGELEELLQSAQDEQSLARNRLLKKDSIQLLPRG